MNRELSPLQVAGILLLFLAILAAGFSFYSHALSVPRLSHLHTDPQGRLHVYLDGELHRFDADGRYDRKFDLRRTGGGRGADAVVLSNGDLLFRYGEADDDVISNLMRYVRQEYRAPDRKAGWEQLLIRCDLSLERCEPFARVPVRLNAVFHLETDWRGGRVFVADTSHHRIYVYSEQGELLQTLADDLKFPNQLSYREPYLFVANTNRHRVEVYETMAGRLERRPEAGFATRPSGENRWPGGVLALSEQVWVINSQSGMDRGRAQRYSREGTFIAELESPQEADLFAFVDWNSRVLVSDYENRRIYQYDLDGKRLADLDLGKLQSRLDELHAEEADYRLWMALCFGAFVLLLAGGFYLGFRQEASAPSVPTGNMAYTPYEPDAGVEWIPFDGKKRRLLRLLLIMVWAMLLACLAFLPFLATLGRGVAVLMTIFSLSMAGVALWITLLVRRLMKQRLGVAGGNLVICDGRSRCAKSQHPDEIYTTGHAVVIGGVFLKLGGRELLFDAASFAEKVQPVLAGARKLSQTQMLLLYMRLRPVEAWINSTLLVGLLILVLWLELADQDLLQLFGLR